MVILGKIPFFRPVLVIFKLKTTLPLYSYRVDPQVTPHDPPIFGVGEPEKTPKTSIIPIPEVEFHDIKSYADLGFSGYNWVQP